MKRRPSRFLPHLLALIAVLHGHGAATAQDASVLEQWDLLVDVRHELVSGYVEEPDQAEMTEAAVRGMIESLGDPYTTYLTQEELDPFDQQVRGTFSGIGAEINLDNGRPRVVTPLEDSPAWNAGILAGDVILEIDGESTLDMSLSDAVQKISGEQGTRVTLRVRHESGEEADITIVRDVINIQTVRGFRRNADQHYDFMLDDVNRIGYVRITQFSQRTADELRDALSRLDEADVQGLILDVRFNPGGLLQSAVEVSDMFLPTGYEIVSVKGRVVPEQVYRSTGDDVMPQVPVVVLANEASASAAEIVTGALADNQRAFFVGARTFGKGSVQQVRMLEGGAGALKLTNAYYYIPSGRLIHRREDAEVWGVDPTEGAWVPMTPAQVREMIEVRRTTDVLRSANDEADNDAVTPRWIEETLKDPQLAAALEAMLGKLDSGDWPTVGESNEQQLLQESKRSTLIHRRNLLRERLDEVEQELASLETDGTAATTPVDADPSVPVESSPLDPAEVRERVKEAEQQIIGEELDPAPGDADRDPASSGQPAVPAPHPAPTPAPEAQP